MCVCYAEKGILAAEAVRETLSNFPIHNCSDSPLIAPSQQPVSAVSMPEESPYATLGDVEPVNLVSFAYQIAAGMVHTHTQ